MTTVTIVTIVITVTIVMTVMTVRRDVRVGLPRLNLVSSIADSVSPYYKTPAAVWNPPDLQNPAHTNNR